jgi:uncharacterized protein YodC (DUF2158 family)
MSANFKIGDLVRLKCGSPVMCINSPLLDYHGQGEESRKCYWVMYYAPGSYTGIQEHRVASELLEPVELDPF